MTFYQEDGIKTHCMFKKGKTERKKLNKRKTLTKIIIIVKNVWKQLATEKWKRKSNKKL